MTHGRRQMTALVPVYYWRGARPFLVDLEADQTGWLVCLTLTYEGDTCLLPLAWQANHPLEETPAGPLPLVPGVATEALDSTAVSLTLADLQAAGWEVTGRLTLYFSGRETEPDFQAKNERYLWQSPADKKKEP